MWGSRETMAVITVVSIGGNRVATASYHHYNQTEFSIEGLQSVQSACQFYQSENTKQPWTSALNGSENKVR